MSVETKKERKRSETRVLPGSDSLTEAANKALANLGSVQEFNERVTKVAEALNISEKSARDMLKSNDGVSDTYTLRKMIRLALMRSDISNDAVKLVRIAQIVCANINKGNEIIERERMKIEAESEQVEL